MMSNQNLKNVTASDIIMCIQMASYDGEGRIRKDANANFQPGITHFITGKLYIDRNTFRTDNQH